MRYIILLASVAIQVCLGGLYAWSNFVPALHEDYGFSTAQTQLVFGCLIAVFTIAMVYAGRLLNRRGPATVAGIGGTLFAAGYLVGSLSDGRFWMLLAGIGGLAGIGTGFCYVCPLTMCGRWFPARKGLATGIAVAGFGGGAVLLSFLAEVLFSRGWDVLAILRWVGLTYGVVILMAAGVLRNPAGSTAIRVRSVPVARVLLRDPFFWALLLGMFCGTFGGLLVIGNLSPLALSQGIAPPMAATAVSAFAAGNAAGRILWGWVMDRIGTATIPVTLIFLAMALATLGPACASAQGLIAASVLTGFGFGACFVVYAAQVGSRYGPERISGIYPLIFLAYGVSGILGPCIGGWLYDVTGSYLPGIAVSLAVVASGLLAWYQLVRMARPTGLMAALKAAAARSPIKQRSTG